MNGQKILKKEQLMNILSRKPESLATSTLLGVLLNKGYTFEGNIFDLEQPKIASPEEQKQKISFLQTQAQEAQQKAKEAETFLKKPWYKQLFTKQTATELPKAAAETLIKQPLKFGVSVAEIPQTVIQGKATQREYKIPGLTPFKSFQSEAETRASQIIEGQKPLYTALAPFAEVPLAAMETVGIAKSIAKPLTTLKENSQLKKTLTTLLPKKFTPTELEKGLKAGRIVYQGKIIKTPTAAPTQYEIEVANTVKNIIKPNAPPNKNIQLIKNQIVKMARETVEPNLKANPQIFNEKTLLAQLKQIKKPALLKSDAVLQNTYDTVIDTAMDIVREHPHNTFGLWKARQGLDDIAEEAKLLEPQARSVAAKAVRDVRDVINQFIIDAVPNGQQLYAQPLRQMSNMYHAIDMIAENAPTKLIRWPRLYKTGKLLKRLSGYTLLGGGLAGGGYGGYKFIKEAF